jgi:hypothetical protein
MPRIKKIKKSNDENTIFHELDINLENYDNYISELYNSLTDSVNIYHTNCNIHFVKLFPIVKKLKPYIFIDINYFGKFPFSFKDMDKYNKLKEVVDIFNSKWFIKLMQSIDKFNKSIDEFNESQKVDKNDKEREE